MSKGTTLTTKNIGPIMRRMFRALKKQIDFPYPTPLPIQAFGLSPKLFSTWKGKKISKLTKKELAEARKWFGDNLIICPF